MGFDWVSFCLLYCCSFGKLLLLRAGFLFYCFFVGWKRLDWSVDLEIWRLFSFGSPSFLLLILVDKWELNRWLDDWAVGFLDFLLVFIKVTDEMMKVLFVFCLLSMLFGVFSADIFKIRHRTVIVIKVFKLLEKTFGIVFTGTSSQDTVINTFSLELESRALTISGRLEYAHAFWLIIYFG